MLAAWLVLSPVYGACIDVYPESRVTESLSEYQACDLPKMRAGYAGILREQVRLLVLLTPAYERQVNEATADSDKRQQLLGKFSKTLDELSAFATALDTAPPVAADGLVPSGAGPGPAHGHAFRKGLKKARKSSHALKSRLAEDALRDEEEQNYCTLDFLVRVGEKLNKAMRECP